MSYKAVFVSVALAFVWTGAALWALRPVPAPSPTPLRLYVASMNHEDYRIQAHDARVEGFCTVFLLDGVRVAAVCGQHTWLVALEVE